MTNTIRKPTWWTALLVVVAMAIPSVAYAGEGKDTSTEEEPPTTETTTAEETAPPEVATVLSTLPVLGSGLNVTISRDENGALTEVALDPSDGATVVKEKDHKVVFLLADGNTEVVVKSRNGVVQTKVKADDPADVSGDGAWTGDVFGNGDIVVPYTVAFDGINPTITVGAITTPADVTAEVGEGKTKTSDDGDRAYYKVKVKFASGEQDAVLVLKAHAKVNDEGETRVSVSATLVSRDRVKCGFGDHDGRKDRRDKDDDNEETASARGDRNSDARWDRDDNDGDRNRGDRDWGDRDGRDRDGDRDRNGGDRDGRDRDGDRDRA